MKHLHCLTARSYYKMILCSILPELGLVQSFKWGRHCSTLWRIRRL